MAPKKTTRKSVLPAEGNEEPLIVLPAKEFVEDTPLETTKSQVRLTQPDDCILSPLQNGNISECDQAVNAYLQNCQKFGIQVDAGVVIALKTG